jgi:hypothetical protein
MMRRKDEPQDQLSSSNDKQNDPALTPKNELVCCFLKNPGSTEDTNSEGCEGRSYAASSVDRCGCGSRRSSRH